MIFKMSSNLILKDAQSYSVLFILSYLNWGFKIYNMHFCIIHRFVFSNVYKKKTGHIPTLNNKAL